MKIALLGYGKMGKIVEQIALQRGHTITPLEQADVAIDFSHESVVLDHVKAAAVAKIPLVMGTTNWESVREEVKQIVLSNKIGCVYTSNFSLGVQLFLQIVEEAAKLIHLHDEYDISLSEIHHKEKKDSPSGTAKEMMARLAPYYNHLPECASQRVGKTPGTHTALFDSEVDTIEITHRARSRAGFALGAVIAAEKILDQVGFFTFRELLSQEHSVI